jgi:hypothetical protein
LSGALTQQQVESSATKAIAAELQVNESAVVVTASSARRLKHTLQGSKVRRLANLWTADFIVSILPSQLSDVQAKVADVKANSTSLSSTMKIVLVAAGVPEDDATVTVNSFDASVQKTTAPASTSVASVMSSIASTSSSTPWDGLGDNNGLGAGASSSALAVAMAIVLLSHVA